MHSSIPDTTPKVFDLIKSLNTSEITYFKKSAKRNVRKKQTYLTAFETMVEMDVYDEKKLVRKLGPKASNLNVVKSQLYTKITHKLHEFHIESSIEEEVKRDIHIIKILLEKNLEKQIPPILRRVRTAITKYELFEQLPDLLKVEQLIWDKNWYKDVNESDIMALHDKMIAGQEQQQNLSLYLMYRCIVQKAHFAKVRLDEHVKLIPVEAFKSPEQAISLRAKIEYYNVLATHYFMTGAVSTAFEYNQKSLKIYEENTKLIKSFPKDYILALNRYLIDSLNLGIQDKFDQGINKIEQLQKQDPFKKVLSLKSKAFEILYRLKFNQIILNEKFELGLELIEEFEPLFEKHKQEIPITPQIEIYYMVAYILFVHKQYKKSLVWLNDITQKRPNMAEEICLFALSIELVAHYECRHKNLDALVVNAHNHIIRVREKLYESEKQLFALLKELHNTPNTERKGVFHKYLPIIEKLKQNPNEERFYGHFDLLRWVQGKLEN